MISHAKTFATILPSLQSLGVTLLYLFREDSIATALSYYKAKASGLFHTNNYDTDASSRDIYADTDEFSKILKVCSADRSNILSLHQTFGGHLMSYEQMTAHWDSFILQLGAWIGVPQLRVEQALSRVSGKNSLVRIMNESQLRDLFHDNSG